MASLVLKMSVSLDGYVAPPDGSSDWATAGRSEDGAAWTLETVSNACTHLIGAATYARWATFWPDAAGPFAKPMNEIPKVVFSNSLASADWPETHNCHRRPCRSRHTAQAGTLRRIPAGAGRDAVRAVARCDRPDRRVPACRASGRPGRGRPALRHTAHHQADQHHGLQPRSRRPRVRGGRVIEPGRQPGSERASRTPPCRRFGCQRLVVGESRPL